MSDKKQLDLALANAVEKAAPEWKEAEEILCQLCNDENSIWAWDRLCDEYARLALLIKNQEDKLATIQRLAAECFIPSWRDLIPKKLDDLLFPKP